MKPCIQCGERKPLDDFHGHPGMRDGHLNKCKVCVRAYTRARPRDPEAERDRLAAWRAAHPDRYKEISRRAYNKYRKTDKGDALRTRRRRREASTRDGVVQYRQLLARDGMWCHICESAIEEVRQIGYDHVIPLVRDGPHTEGNIRVAHRRCNSWKGSRLMSELPGLPEERRRDVEQWQTRRADAARAARSAATRAWWSDPANADAIAARNARVAANMRGNTNGLGNPGCIRHGWGVGLDACASCGTSERPHKALGLCNACYLRDYRAT